MNYEEAKKILDAIRDDSGFECGQGAIDLALLLTGDIEPDEDLRSKGVAQPVPQEDWRGRLRERAILVGASQGRHRPNSGFGSFGRTG